MLPTRTDAINCAREGTRRLRSTAGTCCLIVGSTRPSVVEVFVFESPASIGSHTRSSVGVSWGEVLINSGFLTA